MGLKNNLKYWRHQHMMTQTDFAKHLGISRHQYNRYENQAAQPTLEIAIKIYKIINKRFPSTGFLDIFDHNHI